MKSTILLTPLPTPTETEDAFQRSAEYIDHIRAIPGVRVATASELRRFSVRVPEDLQIAKLPGEQCANYIMNRRDPHGGFQLLACRPGATSFPLRLPGANKRSWCLPLEVGSRRKPACVRRRPGGGRRRS